MSVVNISSSRSVPDSELEQITQLAIVFSRRLIHARVGDITPAIAEALEQIAVVTNVDVCQLLEFTESGALARAHVPARTTDEPNRPGQNQLPDGWLVERLSRGEAVVISHRG